MKRLFIIMSVLLIALFMLAVPSLAAVQNDGETAAYSGANSESEGQTPPAASDKSDLTEQTALDILLQKLSDNSTDILCGIVCVMSGVLVYCYRRGLVPLLGGALSKISGSLSDGVGDLESKTGELRELLEPALRQIEAESSGAAQLAENIKASELSIEEMKARCTELRDVLEGQMDLFYGFFMSINLPEYQKTMLGETYIAAKARLKGGKDNEA